MPVDLTLNGAPVRLDTAPGESLLHALRERAGLRSPKDGCQPQGQCGACLVLVGGQPRTSCAMSAEAVAGRDVLTLEGVSEDIAREAFRLAGHKLSIKTRFVRRSDEVI